MAFWRLVLGRIFRQQNITVPCTNRARHPGYFIDLRAEGSDVVTRSGRPGQEKPNDWERPMEQSDMSTGRRVGQGFLWNSQSNSQVNWCQGNICPKNYNRIFDAWKISFLWFFFRKLEVNMLLLLKQVIQGGRAAEGRMHFWVRLESRGHLKPQFSHL